MSKSHESLQALKNATWITSGARFNAEARLRKRNSSQLWSIALLSASSIVINIAPRFFETIAKNAELNSLCGFLSTTISIAILSLSFYTASSNYTTIADSFHNCAKSLRSLNKRIMHLHPTDSTYDYEKLNTEYSAALDDCPYNHSKVDWDLFLSEKQQDADIKSNHPLSSTETKFIKLKYHLSSYSPYYLTAFFLTCVILISVASLHN